MMVGLIGALALSACGPIVAYDQQGVSVARLAGDLQSCAAEAVAKAPVDITRERITVQVREYRHGIPQLKYDRIWADIDRNEVIREETRVQCMQARGYALTQVPRCAQGAAVTGDTRQAAAGPGSCGINVSGVGPVIVSGS
jgi:hypothetical protein